MENRTKTDNWTENFCGTLGNVFAAAKFKCLLAIRNKLDVILRMLEITRAKNLDNYFEKLLLLLKNKSRYIRSERIILIYFQSYFKDFIFNSMQGFRKNVTTDNFFTE